MTGLEGERAAVRRQKQCGALFLAREPREHILFDTPHKTSRKATHYTNKRHPLHMLQNTKLFDNLLNINRSFAERLVNAIKKIAANLRSFFIEKPLEAKTEYGQALLEAMNKVENRVQELWDKAVAEGIRAENKNAADMGGVKYELRLLNNESDEEKFQRLKNAKVKFALASDKSIEELSKIDISHVTKTEAKSILYPVLDEYFDTFGKYYNSSLEIEFDFSRRKADNSLSHQIQITKMDYSAQALVLANLREICKNAYPVEAHEDYKPKGKSKDIKQAITLFGALKHEDDAYFIKMTVKIPKSQPNNLHMVITTNKIKGFEFALITEGYPTPSASKSNPIITIPQFLSFVKDYDEFTKRIPVKELLLSSEADELSDATTKYSLRKEAPPENTVKGYKVFRVKNGKLYPPMVANPGGEATPVGVWLNADVGERAPDSKTGRAQVKGKGGMSLSFRPGGHLGDIPRASQFDRKNPETGVKELFPSDFVWAECDCAADVDYQDEAMSYGYTEKGKFRHSYAGLPRVPENGYYKYRTNPRPDTVPWIITGAIKVNRILSDTEVEQILKENGVEAPQRQGGNKTLEELGLNNEHMNYSDRFNDSDYLSAVERGDMATAQKMVDEAAKAAGYNSPKLYHGTKNFGFTEFDLVLKTKP